MYLISIFSSVLVHGQFAILLPKGFFAKLTVYLNRNGQKKTAVRRFFFYTLGIAYCNFSKALSRSLPRRFLPTTLPVSSNKKFDGIDSTP